MGDEYTKPDWRERADSHNPSRTEQLKQDQRDSEHRAADIRSERHWQEILKCDPLGKLRIADALLARYDVMQDGPRTDELRTWLRDRVKPLLRDADPAAVLEDPHLTRLVRGLFGEGGVRRLETLRGAA